MIAVRNQKSSLYYEFIIEQKLIPRLTNKKQREKDKIKKAKYGIMIEYLGLGISSNEKDKLEAKKKNKWNQTFFYSMLREKETQTQKRD